MTEYLDLLKKSQIFQSLEDDFILDTISSLNGYTKQYQKNEIVYPYGENITSSGMVLSGTVCEHMINCCENEYEINRYHKGSLFAGGQSLLSYENVLIQFMTIEPSTILFLDFSNLFTSSIHISSQQSLLMANLLSASYRDHYHLVQNIQILIQKHIRSKLIVYFSSLPSTDSIIQIPLNRRELANHLGVERSALSRELCRMKQEGLIGIQKNRIRLLEQNILDLV